MPGAKARAELGREQASRRIAHAPEQLLESLGIPQQGGAGSLVDHLSHRTAEIDVDDVGTGVTQDAGGMNHLHGIASEKLYAQGPHECALDVAS
jgi:hypothetical protein